MTNSHNRPTGGRNAERYYNNSSPQSTGKKGGGHNRSLQPKSPSSNYFNSINVPSNSIPIIGTPPRNGRQQQFSSPNSTRSSPGGYSLSPPNLTHFAGSKCYDAPAPTALPRPPRHWTTSNIEITSLSLIKRDEKPQYEKFPTSCGVEHAASASNAMFDGFSHNLKLMLNVQQA